MAGRDGSNELEVLAAEIESVRPYLDLAHEIRRAVEQFATDDTADVDTLVEAIDSIPQRERARVAQAIFERLPAERQWAILERVYGDAEIGQALAAERADRLEQLRRSSALDAVVRVARSERRLDLLALPAGEDLTLGLFRSEDVRGALMRGVDSQVCARELILRSTAEPGVLRVIGDMFNPRRGLFVTAGYDERVWAAERLASHALVRVGSVDVSGSARMLEPVLYPGGRVDVEVDGDVVEGQLHLGFAVVGEKDIFVTQS